MTKHLKVLIVSAYYPFPRHKYGTNNVNLNILQSNVYYSADVLSLLYPYDKEYIDSENEYDSTFIRIKVNNTANKYSLFLPWLISDFPYCVYRYKPYWGMVAKTICALSEQYDVLHFSTSYLLPVIDFLPSAIREKVMCCPVDTISLFTRRRSEVETNIIKKYIYYIDYKKAKKFESQYYAQVEKLVLASEVDVEEMNEIGIRAVSAEIPNGVDCEFFQHNEAIGQEENTLIFTGNMSYQPNKDSALFIIKTLYPILRKKINGIKIYIVGVGADAELLSHTSDNIIVTGFVTDIRDYVGKSAICISPLRHSGGGFKNKVLEAMAMSKIVVGSKISFEGINGVDKLHYIQIDNFDPENWADAIFEVLTEKNRYKDIGHNARDLIVNVFSWEKIRKMYFEQYVDIYKRNHLSIHN